MNDEAALLAAILANPEEDTPRLVYADWLQENAVQPVCPNCAGSRFRGRVPADHMVRNTAWLTCPHCNGTERVSDGRAERAEFIRVQVECARRDLERPGGSTAAPTHRCKVCRALWVEWPADPAMPPPLRNGSWSLCSAACGKCCDNAPMGEQIETLSEEERALVSREWELLSANGREWANGVIPEAAPSNWSPHDPTPYLVLPGPSYVNIEFGRGFVSHIRCAATDWLAHGDAIRAAHPVMRVALTTIPLSTLAAPGWGLIGDPAGAFFMDADLGAEMQRDPGSANGRWLRALCRLRWKGVTFELPGGAA